jgi:hypothetical protein
LGLYNRPEVAAVPGDVSPTPLIIIIISFGRFPLPLNDKENSSVTEITAHAEIG